ncbi:MAG: hypothetical protein IKY83_11135, partial [Proteobacteria bacterium]|nr:hypothetical protein [Pseudomonadota bacterium]
TLEMPYPLDVFIIQLCIWLTDESDWLIRINCVPKIAFFHSLHDTSLLARAIGFADTPCVRRLFGCAKYATATPAIAARYAGGALGWNTSMSITNYALSSSSSHSSIFS